MGILLQHVYPYTKLQTFSGVLSSSQHQRQREIQLEPRGWVSVHQPEPCCYAWEAVAQLLQCAGDTLLHRWPTGFAFLIHSGAFQR